MNYGVYDVFDLSVFDNEGKFVTQLKSLKESYLKLNEEDGELFVSDALLNIDLLKFIQDSKNKELSDFDRVLKLYDTQTITFNNKKKFKECKLIAYTFLREEKDNKDHICVYEIPLAEIIKKLELGGNRTQLSVFDLVFKIKPYNEDGDLFKMHIHNFSALSIK